MKADKIETGVLDKNFDSIFTGDKVSLFGMIGEVVFESGALTELARYLINHRIEYLVMNGGFVGCNIVKNPLEKFKGKQTVKDLY